MQRVPPVPPPPPLSQATQAPQTRADLDALNMMRSELRDQLSSLTQRRAELIAQERIAPAEGQADIAARLASLDQRSARLEQRIQAADEAIAAGIERGLAVGPLVEVPRVNVSVPPFLPGFYSMRDVMVVNGASLALLAVLFWAVVRRRLRGGGGTPAIADQSRRLDQLQQAVDTMAVEVERISEGQRYVTKVLSERLPATTDRPN